MARRSRTAMGQSHADGPNAWASPTSRSSHFTPRTPATTRPSASQLASCSRLLRRGGGVRIVVLLRLGTRPRLLASGLDLLVPRNPRSQSTTPWFQSNIRDPDLTTPPVACRDLSFPCCSWPRLRGRSLCTQASSLMVTFLSASTANRLSNEYHHGLDSDSSSPAHCYSSSTAQER